jgi:hypothetical protein
MVITPVASADIPGIISQAGFRHGRAPLLHLPFHYLFFFSAYGRGQSLPKS